MIPGLRAAVDAAPVRAGLRRHRRRRASRRLPAAIPAGGRHGRDERASDSARATGRRLGRRARGRLELARRDAGRCRRRLGRRSPRRCGVAPARHCSRSGGRWSSFASAASGLRTLPLVNDAFGTLLFQGRGRQQHLAQPARRNRESSPATPRPRRSTSRSAIDRFEAVVDWPVEAVERKWAGLQDLRPRPAAGLRLRSESHRAFSGASGRAAWASRLRRRRRCCAASLLLGEALPPMRRAHRSGTTFAPRATSA